MILELQPAWVAVDEVFTVKCHVPSVAPLENLALTLLQGNQELHKKNFTSLAVASQRAEVTISVKAQRENDRCNFSCHAELDLSSHGGELFHSSSAIRVLRSFGESELGCGRNPKAHSPHLTFGTKSPQGSGVSVVELHLFLGIKYPGEQRAFCPAPLLHCQVLHDKIYHDFSLFFPLSHFLTEFSQHPQVWVSPLLEVGIAETVSCEVARVFPAKEVAFRLFLGDQELSPFLSWEEDTAWANATVRAMETGDQELSCLISLGPMEQKTREPVHVYSKLLALPFLIRVLCH